MIKLSLEARYVRRYAKEHGDWLAIVVVAYCLVVVPQLIEAGYGKIGLGIAVPPTLLVMISLVEQIKRIVGRSA